MNLVYHSEIMDKIKIKYNLLILKEMVNLPQHTFYTENELNESNILQDVSEIDVVLNSMAKQIYPDYFQWLNSKWVKGKKFDQKYEFLKGQYWKHQQTLILNEIKRLKECQKDNNQQIKGIDKDQKVNLKKENKQIDLYNEKH